MVSILLTSLIAALHPWVIPVLLGQSQLGDIDGSVHTGFLQSTSSVEPWLPSNWSSEDLLWQTELSGYGQSSPVQWENHLYVTSVAGENKEQLFLTQIDFESGRINWETEYPNAFPVESGPNISRAAPTPVCDSAAVYAFFETGELMAVNHQGQVQWQRQLQSEYGPFDNKFGLSASLCQHGESLIVLLEHKGESHLLAIHKADGKNRWVQNRGPRAHSWTTPGLIRVNGRTIVVVSSVGLIELYDSDSGEHLLTYDEVGGNSVATPIDYGAGHFLTGALIRPADGPAVNAEKSNALFQIVEDQGAVRLDRKWYAERARGSFSSPVSDGRLAFWINPQGVLYGVDLETGEEQFSKRLDCGGCWATPILWQDRIFCFGRQGTVQVIRTTPDFQSLATISPLWDQEEDPATLYSALPVKNGFLIRTGNRLYRVFIEDTGS